MTRGEVLCNAANLLQEKGWTQNSIARNSQGHRCEITDEDVASLCAEGAIATVCKSEFSRAFYEALGTLRHFLGRGRIFEWNDERKRTKAEVVEALQGASKAIYAQKEIPPERFTERKKDDGITSDFEVD